MKSWSMASVILAASTVAIAALSSGSPKQSPAAKSVNAQQAVPPIQPFALVALPPRPGAIGVGPPIHITVTGSPLAGTYVVHEFPPNGYPVLVPATDRTERIWAVEFLDSNNMNIRGNIGVIRTLTSAGPVWTATVSTQNVGAGSGAFSGNVVNGQTYGANFPLIGPDFGCAGTCSYVGSPAFGAGGVVTVSVAP